MVVDQLASGERAGSAAFRMKAADGTWRWLEGTGIDLRDESGMRGIVSLAIAIGLPTHLHDGTPFPMRDAIIFISVAVVLFTLIGQGLTLPWIVKRLGE